MFTLASVGVIAHWLDFQVSMNDVHTGHVVLVSTVVGLPEKIDFNGE